MWKVSASTHSNEIVYTNSYDSYLVYTDSLDMPGLPSTTDRATTIAIHSPEFQISPCIETELLLKSNLHYNAQSMKNN